MTIETEQYQIKFIILKVLKVDTVCQLVELKPDEYQDPVPDGQEYGCCIFGKLPNICTIKMCQRPI